LLGNGARSSNDVGHGLFRIHRVCQEGVSQAAERHRSGTESAGSCQKEGSFPDQGRIGIAVRLRQLKHSVPLLDKAGSVTFLVNDHIQLQIRRIGFVQRKITAGDIKDSRSAAEGQPDRGSSLRHGKDAHPGSGLLRHDSIGAAEQVKTGSRAARGRHIQHNPAIVEHHPSVGHGGIGSADIPRAAIQGQRAEVPVILIPERIARGSVQRAAVHYQIAVKDGLLSASILAEVQNRTLSHRRHAGFRLGGGNRQECSRPRHFQIDIGSIGQINPESIGSPGDKGDRSSIDRRHGVSQNIRNPSRNADFQPSGLLHGHRPGSQGLVRLHGNGSLLDVHRAGVIIVGAVEGHLSFTQFGHGSVPGKLASIVGQFQVLAGSVIEINSLGIHNPRQGRRSRMRSVKQVGRGIVHGSYRVAVPDHHVVRHADGNRHRFGGDIHIEGSLVQAGQRSGQRHPPAIREIAGRQILPGNQRVRPLAHAFIDIQADERLLAQGQVAYGQSRPSGAQSASVNRQGSGVQCSGHVLLPQRRHPGGGSVQCSGQSRIRIQVKIVP